MPIAKSFCTKRMSNEQSKKNLQTFKSARNRPTDRHTHRYNEYGAIVIWNSWKIPQNDITKFGIGGTSATSWNVYSRIDDLNYIPTREPQEYPDEVLQNAAMSFMRHNIQRLREAVPAKNLQKPHK